MSTLRTAIRTCPLCESTCGLVLTLDGDRVLRTAGDESDVLSKGYMCPKGATLGELHEDPDWLRRPLVRRDGVLVEATWEEAFDRAAALIRPILRDHGPGAIGTYLGNPTAHNLGGLFYPRTFLRVIGARNLFGASSLDNKPKELVNALLYGSPATVAVPDLDHTDLLVLVGANPMESNGSIATAPGWPRRLRRLRERGGHLVVLDPVRTRTAELADEHLRPRVGSDAALLAAVVFTLIEEDLVDLGRLEEFVTGVDAVAVAVRGLSPEDVAVWSGVPADEVRRLARRIALARRACVYGRMGTTATEFGTIASWMVDLINILTGNLDRRGGAMFPLPATGSPNTRGTARFGPPLAIGRFRSRVRGAPELFGELPTACLAEEIDTPGEDRIRALVGVSGNLVVSAPDSNRMQRALGSLEAYVAVDPYLNDTTRLADVVLPPTGPLQRSHYDVHYAQWAVHNAANYSPEVVAPAPGQLLEWQIMCRLAAAVEGEGRSEQQVDDDLAASYARNSVTDPSSRAFGLDSELVLEEISSRRGPERLLDLSLRAGPYGDGFGRHDGGLTLSTVMEQPSGVDLGPLLPRLPEALRTPTGTIELAPDVLVADLDRLRQVMAAGPPPGLVMIGRRHLRSKNSWMHNVPSLMTGRRRSDLWMSPEDAAAAGLSSGDWATVASEVSELCVQVEVNPRVPAGVVSLPHGWLHDPDAPGLGVARRRPGVNANRLTPDAIVDVPSWNAVYNGIPVRVSAAGAGSGESAATAPAAGGGTAPH